LLFREVGTTGLALACTFGLFSHVALEFWVVGVDFEREWVTLSEALNKRELGTKQHVEFTRIVKAGFFGSRISMMSWSNKTPTPFSSFLTNFEPLNHFFIFWV